MEDTKETIYVSTSNQYDEVFVDLIDYFNKKNLNLVEIVGILEMLKDHILEQHEEDVRFNNEKNT